MALGAVTALKGAGKKPGKDVKIVSIDGTRNAVQAIVDGKINARHRVQPALRPAGLRDRCRTSTPATPIPENVIISDREYDAPTPSHDVAAY